MSKGKLVVIILVVAIISFLIGYSRGSSTTVITSGASTSGLSTNASSSSGSGLTLSMVSLNNDPTNKLYQTEGEYPSFPSAPQLNQEVSNFVGTELSQFETNVAQTWQAEQATLPKGTPPQTNPPSPFEFILSWEPAQLNTHYISFVVRIGADEGGANSTDLVQTFNYDLSENKDVTLGDLFPGKADYLSSIASYCDQVLTEELSSPNNPDAVPASMIQSGTEATPANFSDFTFSGNLVTIYFPKYQVAPGALGEQHVTFAEESIQ